MLHEVIRSETQVWLDQASNVFTSSCTCLSVHVTLVQTHSITTGAHFSAHTPLKHSNTPPHSMMGERTLYMGFVFSLLILPQECHAPPSSAHGPAHLRSHPVEITAGAAKGNELLMKASAKRATSLREQLFAKVSRIVYFNRRFPSSAVRFFSSVHKINAFSLSLNSRSDCTHIVRVIRVM